MNSNAVWVIDNDLDDQDFFEYVWQDMQLPNPLRFFSRTEDLFAALETMDLAPFVIICDYNLGNMSGTDLRRIMLEKHSKRFESVPFIFWSTTALDRQISEAYDLCAHGFFIKDASLTDLKHTVSAILNYWSRSKMPPKRMDKVA